MKDHTEIGDLNLPSSSVTTTSLRIKYPSLPISIGKVPLHLGIKATPTGDTPSSPSTPANVGRRRRPIISLARTAPCLSHATRTADIFANAARELESSKTHRHTQSNAKQQRTPVWKPSWTPRSNRLLHVGIETSPLARFQGSAAAGWSATQSYTEDDEPNLIQNTTGNPKAVSPGREPISSGFSTPSKLPVAVYPPRTFGWPSSTPRHQSSRTECIDPQLLTYPTAEEAIFDRACVDAWLDKLAQSTSPSNLKALVEISSPCAARAQQLNKLDKEVESRRASSNKENRPPSTLAVSWSSLDKYSDRDSAHDLAGCANEKHALAKTPRRQPLKSHFSSDSSDDFLPSASIKKRPSKFLSPAPSPSGFLHAAPIRKRQKGVQVAKGDAVRKDKNSTLAWALEKSQSTHTVHNEIRDSAFVSPRKQSRNVRLSPKVSIWRKGQEPQKTRCASYWDHDILPTLGVAERDAEMKDFKAHVLVRARLSSSDGTRVYEDEKEDEVVIRRGWC
ncbi:hypothetical protein MMC25_001957 [Agyrium rufum]|nr:hypothetical protein [Agyrium rufum]